MPRTRLTFRNAKRLEEIIVILVRFGFSDWVSHLRPWRLAARLAFWRWGRAKPVALPAGEAANPPEGTDAAELPPLDPVDPQAQRWQRFRMVLEELGPTFIKFGQIMSNRADLLPPGLIVELEKLQDQVPPFPAEQVKERVEAELGAPIADIFTQFDLEPVASASIAQVHAARLQDGRQVAVKVQRPGILSVIQRDLEVLALLAGLVERHVPALRHFNPSAMVDEFRKQMLKELDFSQELLNMERFARTFKGKSSLHVPTAYATLSTRRILTMEFIHGTKLSAILSGNEGKHDRNELARRLADLMLEQVFWHGFFHADPHPGNVMVMENDVICFLDFGMMGRIQPAEQKVLVDMLAAMVEQDYHHVTTNLLRLVGHSLHEVPDLEAEIAEILDRYFDQPLGELDFGEAFQNLVMVIQAHALSVPSKYLLMAKALVIAEGVGSQLSPAFSFMNLFGPFARRMALRRLRPDEALRNAWQQGEDWAELGREFPAEALKLLQSLGRGEVSINFRLRGVEPLRHTIESTGTRLVFGLVLAAILISSSLVIRSGVGPYLYGMSAIGVIGFGIAGIMSFGFLASIIRHLFHKSNNKD